MKSLCHNPVIFFSFRRISGKCLCILGILLSLASCKQDKTDDQYVLRIRLREDVDCLHPILSRSSTASQIEGLIMPPMIEYSLDKMELTPLLMTSVPQLILTNDSVSIYQCEFRPEARWDDGSPVTAKDYLFTVKAALNPFIKNPSWKGFLKNIVAVHMDPANPAKMEILLTKNYLLGQELTGNINLYQERLYDSLGIMSKYDIRDLVQKDSSAWRPEELSELQSFAESFQDAAACKSKITGCGPYALSSWDAGSRIVLKKKADWWGEALKERNKLLQAWPDQIEYLIMPDEAATILALKEGSIDLATEISPNQFEALQKEEGGKGRLQFATPVLSKYTYLELNTRQPALAERSVRRALAMLIDVSGFIENVMRGLAAPVVGPVHPTRPYYNRNLNALGFHPEKAAQELAEAGWTSRNAAGILEKSIDGKKQALSFTLLVSGESGKKLALLLQEEAKKIGIEIIPETKDWSLILKDLNELKFDMAAVTVTQSPSLYDPYQSWHSSNSKAGGSNRSGFATPETDSLIQVIRTTTAEESRTNAYLRFQEILHDQQPQIFLFSPKERLVASSRIQVETGDRRPGYLENAIMLSGKK